jgi:hypothetical protein
MHRRIQPFLFVIVFSALLSPALTSAETSRENSLVARYPHKVISNGIVEASVFLPDSEKGFYRSSRYEWSGIIGQLTYKGHTYFMKRRSALPHDPENPGHGMSLAEEFDSNNRGHIPQRFEEAKPGETFMKIGVGNLEKPGDGKQYSFGTKYRIADSGEWKVKSGGNWIEFTHRLADSYGYGYMYVKRLELKKGKAELVLSHILKNTGRVTFSTDQYCHNFFLIDREDAGKSYRVDLFFPARFKTDQAPGAVIRGHSIYIERTVEGALFSYMEGYGDSVSHNRAVVTNTRTGAGVDIRGDFPLFGFNFYSDVDSVCPEFFIYVTVAPGETAKWTRTYDFFAE